MAVNFKLFPLYLKFILLLNTACCLAVANSGPGPSVDLTELKNLKCVSNINAPFTNYNLDQYNYGSNYYETCDVDTTRKALERMRRNLPKYERFIKIHPEKIASYNYLEQLCSNKKLNSLSNDILEGYCSKINAIKDAEEQAAQHLHDYESIKIKNEDTYLSIPRLKNLSERKKSIVIRHIGSVQFATRVCTGQITQSVENYNRIESTVDLKKELGENWQSFTDSSDSLKRLCEKFESNIENEKAIEAAHTTYLALIDFIEPHETELTRLSFNLKNHLTTYNTWVYRNHYPTEVSHKLDKINKNYDDNVPSKIETQMQTVEKWTKIIEQIKADLQKLPESEQPQIQTAIQHVSQYMSENLDITRTANDLLSQLETQDKDIKSLIAEIDAIDDTYTKESLSMKVTVSVLDAVLEIYYQHFDERSRYFYTELFKFQNGGSAFLYIKDGNGITKIKSRTVEFGAKVEKAKVSLDLLDIILVRFLKTLDDNINNQNQFGNDMVALFNKLSSTKIDTPDVITNTKAPIPDEPETPKKPIPGPDPAPDPAPGPVPGKDDKAITPESDASVRKRNAIVIVSVTIAVLVVVVIAIVIVVSKKKHIVKGAIFNQVNHD